VTVIDATSFRRTGFIPTGRDAQGIHPSRDSRFMYVSNRDSGSISVVDPVRLRVVSTWRIPGGGSPDVGGVSPGRELHVGYPAGTTRRSTRSPPSTGT
jgi:YVTN family beta-propeller protein